ncbi:MAG: reverse transcriptase domain-containing protein, partial [Bacilli bacterium]
MKSNTSSNGFKNYAEFSVTIPGTAMIINRKIGIIENIAETDMITWTNEFREIAQLCNWPSEIQINVLHNLVNLSYIHELSTLADIDSKLQYLLRTKYPISRSSEFYFTLHNIKQNDYYTIKDYLNKINEHVNILSISLSWSNELKNEKIQETFYAGLNNTTKLEMVKLGIFNYAEIYNKINIVEEKLIELGYSKNSEHNEKNTLNNNLKISKNVKKYENKYCTFHKSNRHDSSECRAISNSKTQKTSYSIIEPDNDYSLELQITSENKEIKAIIDTGAMKSYITSGALNLIGLKTSTLKNEKIIRLASGNEERIYRAAELTFVIENDQSRTYNLQTYVLENNNNIEIILGIDFLKANKSKINLEENTVIIDGKMFEVDMKEGRLDQNDEALANKSEIRQVEDISNRKEKVNKIIDCYLDKSNDLGLFTGLKHKIAIVKNVVINHSGYTVPLKLRESVSIHIKDLIKRKVIRKSDSHYASPAFVILKRNNNLRLVVDYRKINQITAPMFYPIPRIQETLVQLKDMRWFTQLDLNSGYYQIELEEESKQYTAFVINNEHYEFNRMPFGLSDAPRTFQKAMNRLLGHLTFVKIYLDDILIHSETEEDHFNHVKTVLETLKLSNLTINKDKSSFFKNSVEYLGFVINKDVIKPNTCRINTYKLPEIKTKRNLQKVLGLINYYRPFVYNISKKLSPIYDKLKGKNTNIKWENSDQEIIENIIKEIKKGILLSYPDVKKPYQLYTDASLYAIGGILKQENNLIGIYSYKLN